MRGPGQNRGTRKAWLSPEGRGHLGGLELQARQAEAPQAEPGQAWPLPAGTEQGPHGWATPKPSCPGPLWRSSHMPRGPPQGPCRSFQSSEGVPRSLASSEGHTHACCWPHQGARFKRPWAGRRGSPHLTAVALKHQGSFQARFLKGLRASYQAHSAKRVLQSRGGQTGRRVGWGLMGLGVRPGGATGSAAPTPTPHTYAHIRMHTHT